MPVGPIFYKLCLSACSLPSFSVLPSSSPFHSLSLSLSVYLSSPSEVWIQTESSALLYFFSHTASSSSLAMSFLFLSHYIFMSYVQEFQRPPVCDGTNMSWLSLVEAGTIVCVCVCLGLCCVLTWTDCQRRHRAQQQHVARPIDPIWRDVQSRRSGVGEGNCSI